MMQKKERHPSDPRPDKLSDHKHWKEILWNCWHLEKQLYPLLHGIRCGGAEVTLTQESFRLLPGEWNDSEWDDIRQRLNPFREKLINVFRVTRMGQVSDMDIPEQFKKGQVHKQENLTLWR